MKDLPLCNNCNGTGEGMNDGTRCGYCHGSGVEHDSAVLEDFDEDAFQEYFNSKLGDQE